MKDLILDSPSMQTLWQRYSSVIITFVFWVLWFFLWVPVITAIAWYLGLHLTYFEMFEMDGFKAVIQDFLAFLKVVALLGGSLAVWAGYNFLRFRGKDRRKAVSPVNVEEVASYFKLDPGLVLEQQKTKLLTVTFSEEGEIEAIKPLKE